MSLDYIRVNQLLEVNPTEINFHALSRKEGITSGHLEAYPDVTGIMHIYVETIIFDGLTLL